MHEPRPRPLEATAEAPAARGELPHAVSPLPDRAAAVPAAHDAPPQANVRRAPLRGSLGLTAGLPAPSPRPSDVPRQAHSIARGNARPLPAGEAVSGDHSRLLTHQRCSGDLVDDDEMTIATASPARQRGRRPWHATAAEVGACLQRPPPPRFLREPPFLFPSHASRSVELFPVDRISLAEGNALSRRVVDGLFLWFLMKFGRDRGYGGLRLLTSLDADDMAASVCRDDRLVGRVRHAIVDGLVFSAGTTIVPVCTAGTWLAITVTCLRATVVRVVASVRSGAAISDEAVPEAAMTVMDTSSVGKGEGGWDEHVVAGLFRALTVAICTTYLRTCNDSRKTRLVEDGLRALLPIKVLKTRAGGRETTADNLIAFIAMLLSAELRPAARLLCGHNPPQWPKAHAPRRFRSLVRRLVDAHQPGGRKEDEDEPAEELLNGRDLSDDEPADADDGMRDVDDDYDDSGPGDQADNERDHSDDDQDGGLNASPSSWSRKATRGALDGAHDGDLRRRCASPWRDPGGVQAKGGEGPRGGDRAAGAGSLGGDQAARRGQCDARIERGQGNADLDDQHNYRAGGGRARGGRAGD